MEGRAMIGWMLVFAILVFPTNQAVEGFQMVILPCPGCDQNVCVSYCQDNSCESGRCIFSRHGIHCVCGNCPQ